jgi:homoserine O-acetyltransferase/O-succinyltransferase
MSHFRQHWQPSSATRYLRVATEQHPFVTEGGATLPDVTLAYETWGQLSPARDNVVLVFHALTGDAHAASHPEIAGDRDGWWEPLIGPGRPLDTDHLFVICANALGSCYGSTGPRSVAPDGMRYNLRFPALTVRDLVGAQLRLLDALGIQRLHCAIGGSLGGMQALEIAAIASERVERAVVVAASARFHAQGIAYNELQRRAIMLDPRWQNGEYPDDDVPVEGIALARMVGMLTFQSDESMTLRFGRHPEARYEAWPEFHGRYDIEGYLHYQGDKLATRFDANTYLYLSRVMDSHDLGRDRGGLLEASRLVRAETLFIGVRTDILFPPGHVQAASDAVIAAGGRARYWELNSPHGHDAFLKEFERLDTILREGIGTPEPLPRPCDAVAAD